MKKFYFLFVAVIMAAACVASTIRTACVQVPECPMQNSDNYTVHVSYKEDCHRFYKCNQKCGYLMWCPLIPDTTERLVFNPELQVCDWPNENNKCSDKTAETTTETATTSSTSTTPACTDCNLLDVCLKSQVKKMVHDTDCHKYYVCMYGEKLPTTCDGNKVFNPTTKNCDDPASTTCCVTGTDCEL